MLQLQGNTVHERFLDAVNKLKIKFPVAEIAEKTNYGEPAVSIYLRSKRKVSENFLKKFSEQFQVPFEDLTTINGVSIEWGGEKKINVDNTNTIDMEARSIDYYKDKYIEQLEKQAEKDKSELEKVNDRIEKLETNLNVVLNMQKWTYATVQGFQEEILSHLLKTDRARTDAATSSHSRAYNYLKKVQKEGIPSGENK